MKKRKLGIIGGSGLYKMEGFEKTKWKKINTPWGKPSDEILIAKFGKGATKSGATLKGIFEKAIGKKGKK